MLTATNGAMPAAMLATIDTNGHRLRLDAAASWARMLAAGCPTGPVTSAYRSLEEQRVQYALYLSGQGASALPPGRSQHGEGLAVDIPQPARAWVHAHGAAYGWTFTVPGEDWHAEYNPSTDQHTTTPEDEDMPSAQEIAKATVDELMGRLIAAGDAGLPAAAPFGALIGDMAVHARKAAAAAQASNPDAIAQAVAGIPCHAGDAGLPETARLDQLMADAAVHARKAANR